MKRLFTFLCCLVMTTVICCAAFSVECSAFSMSQSADGQIYGGDSGMSPVGSSSYLGRFYYNYRDELVSDSGDPAPMSDGVFTMEVGQRVSFQIPKYYDSVESNEWSASADGIVSLDYDFGNDYCSVSAMSTGTCRIDGFVSSYDRSKLSIFDGGAGTPTYYSNASFLVKVVSAGGTSRPSHSSPGSSTPSTPSVKRNLDAPVVTSVTNTDSGHLISWNSVSGASQYRVYVRSGKKWKKLDDTSSTYYYHNSAKSGTAYTYTVKCLASDGSSASKFNTKGWKHTFIAQPKIKKFTDTKTGVKLSWAKIKGAAKYRVLIKSGSKWKKLGETSGNSLIHKKAKDTSTYIYSVCCLNKKKKAVSSYNTNGYKHRYLNPAYPATKSVKLNKKSAELFIGKTMTLKATVSPSKARKTFTWTSSNKSVVSVDSRGKLTPKKKGTATITVKTYNGKKAKCKITVNVPAKSVKLNMTSVTTPLSKTPKLKATVSPSNAKTGYTWSSSDKRVVAVDSKGKLTLRKAGTATVTVKTVNGKKASCKITVKKDVSTVKLNRTDAIVEKGKTITLKAALAPSGAYDTVSWYSSDTTVADVSAKGVVTGKKVGTAKITVKTYNGIKASAKITVRDYSVASVAMDKAVVSMNKNGTAKLSVTFTPSYARDKSLTWSSSDPSVVAVSGGVLTAKGFGSATVTAVSSNGKKASCKVYVEQVKACSGTGDFQMLLTNNNNLFTCGSNEWGKLGNGHYTGETITDPYPVLSGVSSFSEARYQCIALTKSGDLYYWGDNYWGQAGNGTRTESREYILSPVKVASGVSKAYITNGNTIILKTNGDLCIAGDNRHGQIGNGEKNDNYEPVTSFYKALGGVADFSFNGSTVAAVKTNGDLYTWGSDVNGNCGNNGTENFIPTDESGKVGVYVRPCKIMSGIRSVSLGESPGTNTALTTDGELYVWGWNVSYAGLLKPYNSANSLPGKMMSGVRYAGSNACITSSGELYTWGSNYWGEVGDGTKTSTSAPVRVLDNVKSFSQNNRSFAALTSSGDLYTWGGYELGLGVNEALTPTLLAHNVTEFSNRYYLTASGDVYGWGVGDRASVVKF